MNQINIRNIYEVWTPFFIFKLQNFIHKEHYHNSERRVVEANGTRIQHHSATTSVQESQKHQKLNLLKDIQHGSKQHSLKTLQIKTTTPTLIKTPNQNRTTKAQCPTASQYIQPIMDT